MPMHVGGKGEKVIQVDKRILEDIGIVKLDLLGVNTLTVVQKTLEYLGKDIEYISAENKNMLIDSKVYEIITSGDTDSIFQLESYGMKDVCQRLKPENINDISAVLALYRPDSMQYLEDYINRKHGREEVEYLHPDMEPILGDTYGCMIYQEQLMNVVRKFGGRSYGGSDRFRKFIGKKLPELVKKESAKLYQEIIDTGYTEELAKLISDDMSEKGGYLFNLSHSMAYAILTIQTAFLKANHPVEYFTALLNCNMDDPNKMNKYLVNAKQNGANILPPKLSNLSKEFTFFGDSIITGIQMIKGLGEKAVDDIFLELENGSFKDLQDFLTRCEQYSTVNKTSIISLIKAGTFGNDRINLMQQYCDYLLPQKEYKDVKTTPTLQVLKDKWGVVTKDKELRLKQYNKKRKEQFVLDKKDRLQKHRKEFADKYMGRKEFWEFDTMSVFLTYNPFKKYYDTMLTPYEQVDNETNTTIAGVIVKIEKKLNKNTKKQYAFIEFNIGHKNIELILWTSEYAQYGRYLEKGLALVAYGTKNDDKFTAKKIKPFNKWKKEKGGV